MYYIATLFIIGNLILPQLCHTIHLGGVIWLPIYFFTLVGAYKYGLHVGIITAIASPLLNSLLFDMPPIASLPIIIIKSLLLAIIAALVVSRYRKISILLLVVIVLSYQFIGTAIEWIMVSDFYVAIQDIRIGIPGMILQVFGGYVVLKCLSKV